jgi:hypothetical protein
LLESIFERPDLARPLEERDFMRKRDMRREQPSCPLLGFATLKLRSGGSVD